MLIAAAASALHGTDIVPLIHVLERVHTQEAIILGGVVAVEPVVSIFFFEERQSTFATCPANTSTHHRVVHLVRIMASLLDKLVSRAVVRTAILVLATNLQVAREISVAEPSFVVWQLVPNFLDVPQAKSTLVRLKVASSDKVIVQSIFQRTLADPIKLLVAFDVFQLVFWLEAHASTVQKSVGSIMLHQSIYHLSLVGVRAIKLPAANR